MRDWCTELEQRLIDVELRRLAEVQNRLRRIAEEIAVLQREISNLRQPNRCVLPFIASPDRSDS